MVNIGHQQSSRGQYGIVEFNRVAESHRSQLRELYELLSANYVEDDDESFRFQYSAEFLSW